MFHDLQESEREAAGGITDRREKRFISFSSTLNDRELTNARHTGSWYIWRKGVAAGSAVGLSVISLFSAIWFIHNVRPDYHAVTVADPLPNSVVEQGFSLGSSMNEIAARLAEIPESHRTNPVIMPVPKWVFEANDIAHNGGVITGSPSDLDALDTSDMWSTNNVYVGGAGDTNSALFNTEVAPLGQPSHTEMREYSDVNTMLKNELRAVAAELLIGTALIGLFRIIGYSWRLWSACRAKFAGKVDHDVIRVFDTRGVQWDILHASVQDAVHQYNATATDPVPASNVWALVKEALGGQGKFAQLCDAAVSKYLVNTAQHQEKLQVKGYPLKRQLKRRMREIADVATLSILPPLVASIHDQRDQQAGETARQKALEQGTRDVLLAEAQAIILGTDHLVMPA